MGQINVEDLFILLGEKDLIIYQLEKENRKLRELNATKEEQSNGTKAQ
ncbi:hypothetical protein [Lysinibacillus capsici]